MTLPPHHPDDLRDVRDAITAVVEEKFGHVCVAGLDWLDTDEAKNHRHILGLWDANEDADYFDELHGRSPALLDAYLNEVEDRGDTPADERKARAAYEYGFDLFDDAVEAMRRELSGPERIYIVRHDNDMEYDSGYDRAFLDYAEAAKLRDVLNERMNTDGGEWHVEEEVLYPTADEAIAEWQREGFLTDEEDD